MSNLYLALNPASGILPIGWHIQCHGFTCHFHEDDPNSIFLFLTLFWAAIYLLDISTYMSSIKICWIIKRKSLTTHLLNDSLLSHLYLTSQGCVSFLFFFFSLIENYLISIHVFPILNRPPSSLPTPSLWVVPVHLSCLSWLTLNQLVCCNSSSLTSIAFSFILSLG